MRPTKLELSGFASFREHTVVDFAGADLFVLCGPTGAGKSSLIDAMTFALYGSVARYGTRLVEPVISQGRTDARVLLDFTVDGAAYRVARVVHRTKSGGATTKEARLEKLPAIEGGDPIDLAIGAREVTAEVESLLGLTFDHFCRTVVLPQGAFQEFLHATAGERQDLLVQLLDLGIYQQIGKMARERAKTTEIQVDALSEQLESVAGVSDEAIATVAARVTALDALTSQVALAEPELEAIRERGAEARAVQTRARTDLERLAGIVPPDGLGDLAERLQAADAAVTKAAAMADAATARRDAAEDQAKDLPAARDFAELLQAIAQVDALNAAITEAGTHHEKAQADAVRLRKTAEEAAAAAQDATIAWRSAETSHGVHALRDHLTEGAPCPLCEQDVTSLPTVSVPEDLESARSTATTATTAATAAEQAARKADVGVAKAAERVASAVSRLEEHQTRIADLRRVPGVDDDATAEQIEQLRAQAATRESELDGLRAAEREFRAELAQAKHASTALDGARAKAMAGLRDAQAKVADLGAPAPSNDLAGSWETLVAWVNQEQPKRQDAVTAADAAVEEAVAAWTARNQLVLDDCTAAGVTVPKGASPTGAVATARAEAVQQHQHLKDKQAEAAELAKKVKALKQQASVASTLGRVLHANNFQKWLLARGLTRLVVGASSILRDLSGGAYSLGLGEDNAFLVADHRNAGEVRHARSLSGGETFLASLALALSLAEHVADLAAKGSARLESLFLDEGFGTLDADTLDVVASSIEELGASGRMVGLITHVPELAQRLPVRFEVTKGSGGSTVERVEA